MTVENIINEAWEKKDQVNQNSDPSLKNAVNQVISDLDSGKSKGLQKKLMVFGKLTNILKKQ